MRSLPAIKAVRRCLWASAVVVICVGCAPKAFERRSLPQLMQLADRDLAPVKAFRAKHGTMTVEFPDPDNPDKIHRHTLSGVHVVFVGPRGLYLSASYLNRPVLQIGSNDDRYWCGVLLPDVSQLSWGYWKYVGQAGSPLRTGAPDRLIEALGQVKLRELSGRFLGPVLPARAPYNVLMYLAVDEPGNWYVAREIVLELIKDRLSVSRIVYYNPAGRIELAMNLSNYRKVTDAGQTGYVPGIIELTSELHKSYMKLKLGKVEVAKKIVPFRFPDTDAFDVVERVDKECGE